ncbi:hypothetical protein [Nocardioides gilvus]|uniref:hypothetical protein n=1 Tax=Nocardioides gilvus TaxID=1735589 RepID=UPI0013A55B04|nr:hypothetical protein [Nocardioides gilvus]
MGSRAKVFMAAMLVALPVTSGLGASPAVAADAITPVGGCWAYVPDRDDVEIFPPVLARDISTEVQPWGPGDPVSTRLSLDTSGETQISGTREYVLTLSDGPIVVPERELPIDPPPSEGGPVPPASVTVESTALFSVTPAVGLPPGEAPLVVRSSPVELEVQPGEALSELEIKDSFPIATAGLQVLRLDTLVFDIPGESPGDPGSVLVCNAQTKGQPSFRDPVDVDSPGLPEAEPVPGINPATTPVATGVSAEFTATAVRSVTVVGVQGQSVTSAARAGDTLDLRIAGLAPDTEFTAQICGAEVCSMSTDDLVTDATGAATTSLAVSKELPSGDAKIRIASGGVTLLEMDLVVLGAPTIATSEEVGDESVTVTVEGADWDPNALIKIKGLVDDDRMSGQQGITVDAAADGTFTASFEVTDPQAVQIRVRQERPAGFEALELRQSLENKVPGTRRPPPPKEEVPPPVSAPPPSSVTPPAAAPATVNPPVTIPVPAKVPVEKVEAPPTPEGTTPELSVSEVRLDGEASLGELFGGPSRREVILLVENTGTVVATNPLMRLGVGRDTEVDPVIVAAEVGDLQPGARVVLSVDVALPMASFGTYQVVGQVGDSEDARFTLKWETYPWGLIALNLAGVALLAWGVRRRQRNRTNPAPFLAQGEEDEAGASVIDITALDEWWEHGRVSRKVTVEPDDNDSIVDLDAADRWWARRDDKVS